LIGMGLDALHPQPLFALEIFLRRGAMLQIQFADQHAGLDALLSNRIHES